MSKLNSTDSCALIDVEQATIDPRVEDIDNAVLKALFQEIHRIILNNGVDLVKKVKNAYGFVIQIDNDRPLGIDKNIHVSNVDYVEFTIDLKSDRGVIYVGPSKIPPILVFNMREQDFIALLSGNLNYMKAITGKKMALKGNVLNVMGFYKGFVLPYLNEYLQKTHHQ